MRADLGCAPAAGEALLRRFAASDDAAQRAAVARNPNTPLDVLLDLVGIVDDPPGHGLASNPARPPELVALLDLHHYTAENLPKPDGAPMGWGRLPFDATALDAMSTGTSGHPSYPVTLLDGFIRSGANMAGYDAASNPWLTEAQLAVIAEDPYAYARQKVLQHPGCTPKLLSKLADDPQPLVRGTVAAHPFRTADEIAADAKDPAREVRQGVAQNPSTPVELLVALSADEDASVRASVAMHARTPVSVLTELSKDEATYVRSRVAVHPATPKAIVDHLAKDDAPDVAKAADWRRRYEAAAGHPPRLVRT